MIYGRGLTVSDQGPMAGALAPLRARLGRPIREREVLRVAATLTPSDQEAAVAEARRAVLAWAQRRCGGDLPKRAWLGESFEYIAAGRTTLGARLGTEEAELWALRGDDPDKNLAGRVWTTEVAIGRQQGREPHLSDRLTMAWPDAAGGDSSSGCGPERPEAGWPSLAGRQSAIRLT